VATRGSAETEQNCLEQNLQPQINAIVAIQTLGSRQRVLWATQTFAERFCCSKKVEKHWLRG